jgi:hypothetical protein
MDMSNLDRSRDGIRTLGTIAVFGGVLVALLALGATTNKHLIFGLGALVVIIGLALRLEAAYVDARSND